MIYQKSFPQNALNSLLKVWLLINKKKQKDKTSDSEFIIN